MTPRLETLVEQVIAGELAAPELTELNALAKQDPQAARYVQQMLLVETALRARASAPDVADTVLGALKQREQNEQAQTLAVVMARVQKRTRPGGTSRRAKRPFVALSLLLAATAAFAATAHFRQRGRQATSAPVSLPAEATFGSVGAPRQTSVPLPPPDAVANTGAVVRNQPPPISPSAHRNLFAFDFEDGQLPSVFEQGAVVPAPVGTESRYIVEGTFNPWAPNRSSVILDNGGGVLFAYEPSLVLRFRYFLAGTEDGLRVQMFNIDQRQNYQWTHPNPVRGSWSDVSVALTDFYPVLNHSASLETGNRIQNVHVLGGPFMATPLRIDDFALGSAP